MKKLFLIACLEMFMFGCSPILKSNSNDIEQKAVGDNFLLSETESTYLNSIFEATRKDFDFTNKQVGFIKISGKTGKNHYFDMQEKHSADPNYPCDNGTLYIFNAAQKTESGGYDAAIVFWCKFSLRTEDVVKRLRTKS